MNRTPIESFLDLTRKSGLLEPNRFALYLERLEKVQPIPEEPKEMANVLVRDAVLSRFQADQLLSGKWRGFYVGKYRVIERIGIGGMGQVYLAEHRTMKRRYAIKVLPRSKATDPASLERFEREARAGGSIDHPNIVRAYDKDQDGDLHYLVMDFVDGCSLAEIVSASGPLDFVRAGNYFYQSALGLKHAHDSGLIHRDIKPANILIDRQGVVKILDMGLARFFNDETDMITKKYDETVLGTADYLSPEQAIDSHNVDIRSDIYSLGCTFYYTLTGSPPFGEGSVAQKLIWHQTRTPKSITELRADVPKDLQTILSRCMMKQASDRYESPEALLTALSHYAEHVFPPSEDELAQLSPMARGVPFGGEILSGITSGTAAPTEPPTKDPDSTSPIFDSHLIKRGNDDSTVNIRSGDSSVKNLKLGSTKTTPPPVIAPVPLQPTLPVLVTPAKAAGIAPRPQSSPPIIIGNDPPPPVKTSKTGRTGEATPLAAPKQLNERLMEVLPAKEGPAAKRKSITDPFKLKKTWLIAIAASFLVILIVVLILVFRNRNDGQNRLSTSKFSSAVPTQAIPAGPRKWHVARTKLDGIDFTSISEALAQAGPGDTIVITDRQTYTEPLVLTPATSKRGFSNITIQGEISDDGKRAKLTPSRTHQPVTPLLSIEGVTGLKIIGLLFDGEDSVQTTLSIKGTCPGLVLEDVRLEGFQQHGVIIDSLTGMGRREALLSSVHIRQNHPQPAQSALLLQGSLCDGLQLKHCRFQGRYASTIKFAAPMQRILMEQCKFYGGKGTAIQWSDSIPSNQRMNATIQQNTFWDYAVGFNLDVLMNANEIYFTVRNNLFYQVKSLLHVDTAKTKMKPESLAGGWVGMGNVFDTQSSQPGMGALIPKFGCKGLTFTLNTSMTPPQEFLRYPAGSPLQSAGERNDAVGAID